MELKLLSILIFLGIILLCGIIFHLNSLIKKSSKIIVSINNDRNELKQKLEQYNDNCFCHITLKQPIKCEYSIIQLDNKKVEVDKKAIGSIIKISRSGMLLETDFNFPLETKDVLMKYTFALDNTDFNIDGKLISKEKRNKDNRNYYGVTFLNIPSKIDRKLSLCINQAVSVHC
ncbi:PilZ domain-containing protein [Virgibacillus halodenitrificans]|uniref:PilZ domain-containing protein n=1 Tax=Virgibacillus halodenitrificans TaxID=1482 RepID=UPI000EF4A1B7|nr:PilZ domain-containing protein [Virgibacillus halodenitrificans]